MGKKINLLGYLEQIINLSAIFVNFILYVHVSVYFYWDFLTAFYIEKKTKTWTEGTEHQGSFEAAEGAKK